MAPVVVFLDTETTGVGPDAEVVELAWQADEPHGTLLFQQSCLVRPNSEIPFAVSQIHGITTGVAREHGRDIRELLAVLQHYLGDPDCLLVCHNAGFDIRVINHSASLTEGTIVSWPKVLCTMKSLTFHVKARDKLGNIKDPRLSEAYRWMFGREPEGLHRARHDMLAVREIYYEGRNRGLWS